MTAPSFTLYASRHGRTSWNAQHRLQGQCDIALDDVGRAEARGNGRLLAGLIGSGGGYAFVASPLIRARETMELIRAEMGLPPAEYECDPRLKEVRFGDWEGREYLELSRQCPDLLAARQQDPWNFVPPGGESYAEMSGRIEAWLASVDQDTLMVAHGGVLRILQVLLGDAPTGRILEMPAPQDRIMRVQNGHIKWLPASVT